MSGAADPDRAQRAHRADPGHGGADAGRDGPPVRRAPGAGRGHGARDRRHHPVLRPALARARCCRSPPAWRSPRWPRCWCASSSTTAASAPARGRARRGARRLPRPAPGDPDRRGPVRAADAACSAGGARAARPRASSACWSRSGSSPPRCAASRWRARCRRAATPRSSTGPPSPGVAQAVGELLVFGHGIDTIQLRLAAIMLLGLVGAARLGGLRWVIGSGLLFGVLFVLTAASTDPIARAIASIWWDDSWRFVGLAALPMAVLIGNGVAEVQRGRRRARRQSAVRRPRHRRGRAAGVRARHPHALPGTRPAADDAATPATTGPPSRGWKCRGCTRSPRSCRRARGC